MPPSTMIASLLIVLPAVVFAADLCVNPSGIDASCDRDSTTCLRPRYFKDIPIDAILSTAVDKLLEQSPGFLGAEAPIQAHWMSIIAIPVYGTAAAFHSTAFDMFGRRKTSDSRRRCDASTSGLSNHIHKVHRKATLAYSVLWGISAAAVYQLPDGGAEVPMRELATEWGIDFDICDRMTNCADISTPWGLAKTLVDEALLFTNKDGWNWRGKVGKHHYNLIPYRDFRENMYIPQNDPWTLSVPEKWQPLLEDSMDGFLSRQVFVTSHIGETAYSLYLGNEEICSRAGNIENPNYNLDAEARLVLKRTRKLDSTTKSEIEFFDSKFESLLQTFLFQFLEKMEKKSDSFKGIQMFSATVSAIREATILAWKAKVDFDLVRPTSFIHDKYKDVVVNSYGGPDVMKSDQILGQDWQSYIRTMPHAEFPSGTACICKAFAEVIVALTGSDDITNLIGESLVRNVDAGSSKIEEGMPESNLEFEYNSWSEIVDRCSQTRVDGGMHFTASISASAELCGGIGDIIAISFQELKDGKQPSFHQPKFRQSSPPPEKRC